MKRTIILIRHGKACSPDKFEKDIDRVLAERGINDGYRMAGKLIQNGYKPDIILSSPAARASHTALIFIRAMDIDIRNLIIMDKLYHCSASTMMDEVYNLSGKISTVAIAAHNPGITDLAWDLTSGATNFIPTTGIAIINYDIENWPDILNAKPKDYFFITPREINPV